MMSIPIENIYYLLCYAWDKLEELDKIQISTQDKTELVDLFAQVFGTNLSHLLRRGLDRYYNEVNTQVYGIKGKLNLASTVKQNALFEKKTVCIYDEFEYDILHNQIIKSTLKNLLRTSGIDKEIHSKLYKLYIKLPPISEIHVRPHHFNQVVLHRNNHHYDLILKICEIIQENLLINEEKGNYWFKDFSRDEKKMARLFENFVRNFYKVESDFLVSREVISWQFYSEDIEDISMLPRMNTDITLESPNRKIIIDTKYYPNSFQKNYEKISIHSSNLYQLFAYINNQENNEDLRTMECEGILLYPTIEEEFEFKYKYQAHPIRVMSIKLNQNWKLIESDLLKIVQ